MPTAVLSGFVLAALAPGLSGRLSARWLGWVLALLPTGIFIWLPSLAPQIAIGRAGYFIGLPLWSGTIKDELKGQYDRRSHRLNSPRQTTPNKPE